MTEPTRRELIAREAALVAELDSRMTNSQRQAENARRSDQDAETTGMSASARQAAWATRTGDRQEVES